tara:strand:- start:168 stop:650 length:483 start_codon:yes stop_codon:yes gene_type:complete
MLKKIYSNINELEHYTNSLKKKKLIVGLTNGCFDLLHPGHLYLLSKARELCDFLIVALNSDSSVRSLKGSGRPVENEEIRCCKLAKLEYVDSIIIFSDVTPLALIKQISPQVLIKGADYLNKDIVGSTHVINNGGKVEVIDILSGYSTSRLIDMIKNNKS